MNGWLVIVLLVLVGAGSLLGPWTLVAGILTGGFVLLRRGHGALAWFTGISIGINAILLAILLPARPDVMLGPLGASWRGFEAGIVAGMRLAAILVANVAVLQIWSPAWLLSRLGLPRQAEAFLAAVLIAAHDVGRDAQRIVEAQQAAGAWPDGRVARARAAARLLPLMLVAAHDRALRRRDALQIAGHPVGPRFAPIVAVTALAAAGRLAFVALPNVSLTFVIVFAGGVAFGGRVGAWSGFWAMLLTDLMLSGLAPQGLVNIPATVLLGAAGGWFRADGRADSIVAAAAIGVLGTMAWSVATDAISWLVVAENRQSVERLWVGMVAGLAFNVVPAIVNGVLFAAAIGPVDRAFRALRAPA